MKKVRLAQYSALVTAINFFYRTIYKTCLSIPAELTRKVPQCESGSERSDFLPTIFYNLIHHEENVESLLVHSDFLSFTSVSFNIIQFLECGSVSLGSR